MFWRRKLNGPKSVQSIGEKNYLLERRLRGNLRKRLPRRCNNLLQTMHCENFYLCCIFTVYCYDIYILSHSSFTRFNCDIKHYFMKTISLYYLRKRNKYRISNIQNFVTLVPFGIDCTTILIITPTEKDEYWYRFSYKDLTKCSDNMRRGLLRL